MMEPMACPDRLIRFQSKSTTGPSAFEGVASEAAPDGEVGCCASLCAGGAVVWRSMRAHGVLMPASAFAERACNKQLFNAKECVVVSVQSSLKGSDEASDFGSLRKRDLRRSA